MSTGACSMTSAFFKLIFHWWSLKYNKYAERRDMRKADTKAPPYLQLQRSINDHSSATDPILCLDPPAPPLPHQPNVHYPTV